MQAVSQNHDALAQQLQQAIERIQGVNEASIVLDEAGEIAEIHLVSSSDRKPKQIVRDTESLLSARFGIRVDYRKISLVQLDHEGRSGRKRLRFISAAPHPQETDSVQVVLQTEDGRFEGIASFDPSTTGGDSDIHAAVKATLSAVQQAVGHIVPLAMHETHMIQADGSPICLAIVRASTTQGEERLTGTCLVTSDVLEAASKAALDAINRRLPVWTMAASRAREQGQRPLSTAR